MKEDMIWKKKYEALVTELACLAEDLERRKTIEPDKPWSDSEEFFISNSLDVCDNEDFAIKNWGEGKYIRVVKAQSIEEES